MDKSYEQAIDGRGNRMMTEYSFKHGTAKGLHFTSNHGHTNENNNECQFLPIS